MHYQALDWDSNFFGFRVSRITNPQLEYFELKDIVKNLRAQRVKLAYWPSLQELNPDLIGILNGLLVDVKTTFVANLPGPASKQIPISNLIEPYSNSMPRSDFEDLAIQSSKYSRFAMDPKFPREKLVDMYKVWINKCLNKEMASEVLAIRDSGRVVGMATLGDRNSRGDIGLIAVSQNYRGRGFGETLVRAAQKLFCDAGYEISQVVTQGRNLAACNLYKKCGYSIEKKEYFYHFWP